MIYKLILLLALFKSPNVEVNVQLNLNSKDHIDSSELNIEVKNNSDAPLYCFFQEWPEFKIDSTSLILRSECSFFYSNYKDSMVVNLIDFCRGPISNGGVFVFGYHYIILEAKKTYKIKYITKNVINDYSKLKTLYTGLVFYKTNDVISLKRRLQQCCLNKGEDFIYYQKSIKLKRKRNSKIFKSSL